jgi:thiamine-phosphate pyrophosphorylase
VHVVAITDRRLMVPAEVLAGGDWAAIATAFGAAIARARFPQGAPSDQGVADPRSAADRRSIGRPRVDEVQVREKDLDGGPLLQLVRAALATGARVIVNDRIDVALAAGAHGVHLPERGLPVAIARRLAPRDFTIGVSCHALDAVRAAADAGADRVHLGPIWETPGKGAPIGLVALAMARAELEGPTQLVAIGGIDSPLRVAEALRSGAHAVAAIRAVWAGGFLGL